MDSIAVGEDKLHWPSSIGDNRIANVCVPCKLDLYLLVTIEFAYLVLEARRRGQ